MNIVRQLLAAPVLAGKNLRLVADKVRCLSYTLLITESTLSSMYQRLIFHGQTPSIRSSRILGGQHPALLSDRSRKPLRVERTSPRTHSGATWGYLCTQIFDQQQPKILK